MAKTVPLQSRYSFCAILLMHDCEFAATKWRTAHNSIFLSLFILRPIYDARNLKVSKMSDV